MTFHLKYQPAIIVDQNALRNSHGNKLEDFLKLGGYALLTDVAIAEMLKSESNWNYVFDLSTKIISNFPNQVAIIKGVGEILRYEKSKNIPMKMDIDSMVANDTTKIFRNYLINKEDKVLNIIRHNIASAQSLADRQYFNGAFSKVQMEKWINVWEEIIDKELKKELLSAQNKWETIYLIFKYTNFSKIVKKTIEDVYGYSLNVLIRPTSYHYLTILVNYTIALIWFSKGGFNSAKESTITNELADGDYIAHALLFDGIISYDNKVNELYSNINKIIKQILVFC